VGIIGGVFIGVPLGLLIGGSSGVDAWWRIEGWPTAEEWQGFGAIATVIVAVSAVFYARRQVVEARDLRLEQAQPYVVATPIPELSTGRQACLLIRNYGSTVAQEICVHFPEARVAIPEAKEPSTWTSTSDLRLATSTLAPGQEIFEWVSILDAADDDGVRCVGVEVSCTNWRGERQTLTYNISHGPANIFGNPPGLSDVVHELGHIGRTMENWSAADRRALVVESPRESTRRIFGE
jgi:hypothetical protein